MIWRIIESGSHKPYSGSLQTSVRWQEVRERPHAAFRIRAARPSHGRSWRPARLVRVRLYCARCDRRRLATAAVAYRGCHPLRVCSIEASDSITIADDRGGDSRRAVDFPVDDKGQVSADVLFGEFMNALRRIIGHSEVENPLVPGLRHSGAGDIARSHERSPRHQDSRRVVQSDGLGGIRLRIRDRAHLDGRAWRACLLASGTSET